MPSIILITIQFSLTTHAHAHAHAGIRSVGKVVVIVVVVVHGADGKSKDEENEEKSELVVLHCVNVVSYTAFAIHTSLCFYTFGRASAVHRQATQNSQLDESVLK